MTRAKIADAAILLRQLGQDNFSIRRVAKLLYVVPATIHAHFRGGMGDL